ncbi:uncharacterized protein MONBRDRAFT_44364, partial [Monosiga brevicollis MX1]
YAVPNAGALHTLRLLRRTTSCSTVDLDMCPHISSCGLFLGRSLCRQVRLPKACYALRSEAACADTAACYWHDGLGACWGHDGLCTSGSECASQMCPLATLSDDTVRAATVLRLPTTNRSMFLSSSTSGTGFIKVAAPSPTTAGLMNEYPLIAPDEVYRIDELQLSSTDYSYSCECQVYPLSLVRVGYSSVQVQLMDATASDTSDNISIAQIKNGAITPFNTVTRVNSSVFSITGLQSNAIYTLLAKSDSCPDSSVVVDHAAGATIQVQTLASSFLGSSVQPGFVLSDGRYLAFAVVTWRGEPSALSVLPASGAALLDQVNMSVAATANASSLLMTGVGEPIPSSSANNELASVGSTLVSAASSTTSRVGSTQLLLLALDATFTGIVVTLTSDFGHELVLDVSTLLSRPTNLVTPPAIRVVSEDGVSATVAWTHDAEQPTNMYRVQAHLSQTALPSSMLTTQATGLSSQQRELLSLSAQASYRIHLYRTHSLSTSCHPAFATAHFQADKLVQCTATSVDGGDAVVGLWTTNATSWVGLDTSPIPFPYNLYVVPEILQISNTSIVGRIQVDEALPVNTRFRIRITPFEGESDALFSYQIATDPLAEGNQQFRFTVTNLVPATTYDLDVALENEAGLGFPSNSSTNFTTSAGLPNAPVITQRELTSSSARVQWAYDGIIDEFEVVLRMVGTDSEVRTALAGTARLAEFSDLSTGASYELSVLAFNHVGSTSSNVMYINLPVRSASQSLTEGLSKTVVAGVTSAILLIIVILLAFCIIRGNRQRRYNEQLEQQLRSMKLGVEELTVKVRDMFSREFAETIGADGEAREREFALLELDRARLKLGKELGKGAFGIVCVADLQRPDGRSQTVAVKALLDGVSQTELEKFLMEARLMSLLHHESLLELVAVCTKETPFYIVTEIMPKGDLKQYLRDCRPTAEEPRDQLTNEDLTSMVVQISNAMRYLEEMKVIHRDLAARNILVAENNVVKLADFGMSRNIYEADYYKKQSDDRVPVKWMAPESVNDRIYTNLSDVWSFGILCWEVYSYARAPYAEYTAMEAVAAIAAGYRLPKPDACPDAMYDIMMRCWMYVPANRPDFVELVEEVQFFVRTGTVRTPYKEPEVDLASSGTTFNDAGYAQEDSVNFDESNNALSMGGDGYLQESSVTSSNATRLTDNGYVLESEALAPAAETTRVSLVNSSYSSDAPARPPKPGHMNGASDGHDSSYVRDGARLPGRRAPGEGNYILEMMPSHASSRAALPGRKNYVEDRGGQTGAGAPNNGYMQLLPHEAQAVHRGPAHVSPYNQLPADHVSQPQAYDHPPPRNYANPYLNPYLTGHATPVHGGGRSALPGRRPQQQQQQQAWR